MDEIICCRYEDFARALADETRQAILELLTDQELNVSEIAAHFDLSQPTISHHLGLLRRAGVVLTQKKGRYVFYSVNRCCMTACARRLIEPFVESTSNSREEP
ncbi:MAG: winged helix-turn-helix transcriptional regulator [Anaerolineae bacterium]|nr:winged helix-turn-helix transcriptional regulator [Anaerolineae bacterium]